MCLGFSKLTHFLIVPGAPYGLINAILRIQAASALFSMGILAFASASHPRDHHKRIVLPL